MAIHKLTWGFVQKVAKNGMYGDGGGLWLQVTNDGSGKSWLFRWTDRRSKQDRNMGLGPVHTVDIAHAREAAKKCREIYRGQYCDTIVFLAPPSACSRDTRSRPRLA